MMYIKQEILFHEKFPTSTFYWQRVWEGKIKQNQKYLASSIWNRCAFWTEWDQRRY